MYKILIRPLEIEDASISWKWRNDHVIWKFTGKKPDIVVTEEIEKTWLAEKLSENNSARFAITVDNIYIGNIQLTNIKKNENAEYHIFIGEKTYWGKGIAGEATSQIIRYARYILNLKSLYLSVNPDNLGAIKLYEKAGFQKVNNNMEMKLDLNHLKIPVVSVFMMTYNHEKYISEAIDGVLMQITSFDFEIVIGEDCSTDRTREIILSYQEKYPGKFKLLLHEKNIGAMANQMTVLKACTGKYIALCEGDDYWTDPLKLQKQVDFLEKNKDYVLITHKVSEINEKNIFTGYLTPRIYKDYYTYKDINININIWTCSVLFRNINIQIPKLNKKLPAGDFLIWLLLSEHGKFAYLDIPMSVYRHNKKGIHSSLNKKDQIINGLYMAKIIQPYFPSSYKSFFLSFSNLYLIYLYDEIIRQVKQRNSKEARKLFFIYLKYNKQIRRLKFNHFKLFIKIVIGLKNILVLKKMIKKIKN